MLPIQKAPPAFMKRYNAIMDGSQPLDTVAKLKDFWLFGIEQGWPHPEMREHMAKLMISAGQKYCPSFRRDTTGDLWMAYDFIESCEFIGSPMDLELDKKMYDTAWIGTQVVIDSLNPAEYDKKEG